MGKFPVIMVNNVDTSNYFIDTNVKTGQYNMIMVMDDLLVYKVKHPDIVIKQVVQETGHLKSKLCKENKNLFGFRNTKHYLKFDSYTDCVKFYKNWQDKRYKSGDYYEFLDNINYASDTLYTKTLKRIKIHDSIKSKSRLQRIQSDSL